MAMIEHETLETIAVLSESGSTQKALTVTRWGSNPAKIDLRTWREKDGEKLPGKGLTLTRQEAETAAAALTQWLGEHPAEQAAQHDN